MASKMVEMAISKPYRIAFKIQPCPSFPHGLSDSLDIDFATVKSAKREIEAIEQNPGDCGLMPEMKDASMWVTDEAGNVY